MVPIVGKQLVILALWLALSTIVVVVFAWVVSSTRRPAPQGEVQPGGYRLRRLWGWFYGTLLVAAFLVTLWTVPYAWAQGSSAKPALVVHVYAHQFAFTMPQKLPAQTPIEFLVTSLDVNHDMGIYSPQGVLLGQVQAMPDYTNVFFFTFPAPGRYIIRCLELCGAGHSSMFQPLQVYQPASAAAPLARGV